MFKDLFKQKHFELKIIKAKNNLCIIFLNTRSLCFMFVCGIIRNHHMILTICDTLFFSGIVSLNKFVIVFNKLKDLQYEM